ncbi:MAG: 1-(5-phosphoribosyl)-5-[(5-phosphoribosylamino)methylideneamino]imidazole-4-carboxamide isomerase [Chloroflexi bacterium]|nr:1-(5-phosphoribosyl)-5-[(5-phosphoribosylamino)methylideneamino]imidazole-4-carboxamide isomerase [Chloroflexota bacterium]
MIIYPAVDIRDGRVVRLVQGDPNQQTVHSDNPLQTAQRWRAAGADWLHIVNLDGAFGEGGFDFDLLRQIKALEVSIQFGGGLRSFDAIDAVLSAGADRVVLGTLLVQQPELAAEAIERFGAERIAVALDARGGKVAIHGWQQATEWTPIDLGRHFAAAGVRYALYTDILRDGLLKGVNVEATARLAAETGLSVIASGGVSTLQDLKALRTCSGKVHGAVIGKALYAGAIQLNDALRIAE